MVSCLAGTALTTNYTQWLMFLFLLRLRLRMLLLLLLFVLRCDGVQGPPIGARYRPTFRPLVAHRRANVVNNQNNSEKQLSNNAKRVRETETLEQSMPMPKPISALNTLQSK